MWKEIIFCEPFSVNTTGEIIYRFLKINSISWNTNVKEFALMGLINDGSLWGFIKKVDSEATWTCCIIHGEDLPAKGMAWHLAYVCEDSKSYESSVLSLVFLRFNVKIWNQSTNLYFLIQRHTSYKEEGLWTEFLNWGTKFWHFCWMKNIQVKNHFLKQVLC